MLIICSFAHSSDPIYWGEGVRTFKWKLSSFPYFWLKSLILLPLLPHCIPCNYQIFHILLCFNRSPQSEHLCSLKGPNVWKVSQRCLAKNNGCRSSKCDQMEKFKGSSVFRRVPFAPIEDIDKSFLHELKVVVLKVCKRQAITRCKSKP